jgi:CheY-like chemotaxis protein
MSEVESRTAPLKFLVVEDHPEVAQNNCEWLQRIAADAQCIAVSNPMDAIRRLQREQPDLVVADLLYGQTTGEQSAEPGLELLRHIFENYPTLNVMVYSSEPLLLTPLVGLISKHQADLPPSTKWSGAASSWKGPKVLSTGNCACRESCAA